MSEDCSLTTARPTSITALLSFLRYLWTLLSIFHWPHDRVKVKYLGEDLFFGQSERGLDLKFLPFPSPSPVWGSWFPVEVNCAVGAEGNILWHQSSALLWHKAQAAHEIIQISATIRHPGVAELNGTARASALWHNPVYRRQALSSRLCQTLGERFGFWAFIQT